MTGMELISSFKDQIMDLARMNGISNVRIFGSVVRGEEKIESDIDLLVSIEEDRTLFDLIRFKQAVEDLVGRKVDVVSDQAVHHTLKQRIVDEAVQL